MKKTLSKINWLKVAQITAISAVALAPLAALALTPGITCPPGMKCGETNINQLISTIISWLLGIAFGIAVLFLIIGGFWYITSAGNEETAEKGKNTAINAIIGIIIIVLSYVVVNVVSNLLTTGSTSTGP